MADEKVNMGPEENKPPETLSLPGQGNLPPLEENNAPAVSGEDKTAPDHVEPDPHPRHPAETGRSRPNHGELHRADHVRQREKSRAGSTRLPVRPSCVRCFLSACGSRCGSSR